MKKNEKKWVVRKYEFDYSKMDDCGNFPKWYITKDLKEDKYPVNDAIMTEEEADQVLEKVREQKTDKIDFSKEIW